MVRHRSRVRARWVIHAAGCVLAAVAAMIPLPAADWPAGPGPPPVVVVLPDVWADRLAIYCPPPIAVRQCEQIREQMTADMLAMLGGI